MACVTDALTGTQQTLSVSNYLTHTILRSPTSSHISLLENVPLLKDTGFSQSRCTNFWGFRFVFSSTSLWVLPERHFRWESLLNSCSNLCLLLPLTLGLICALDTGTVRSEAGSLMKGSNRTTSPDFPYTHTHTHSHTVRSLGQRQKQAAFLQKVASILIIKSFLSIKTRAMSQQSSEFS